VQCDSPPPECLIEHLARSLPNARPGKNPGSVSTDCPLCHHAGSVTITAGNKRRFVITCHAGCADTKVRLALLRLYDIRVTCLPPVRGAIKTRPAKAARRSDAEIVSELAKMLREPLNGNAYRLRAAMLLLNMDAEEACKELGIPERTRRRLLCP
jgi:hypothetical protein